MSVATSTGSIVQLATLAATLALAAASPLIHPFSPEPQWPAASALPVPHNTDHGLYNLGFVEGDIVPPAEITKAASDEDYLWPNATIIYKIHETIGCPESPQCQLLMQAMEHFHHKTCVRFKEWTGEKDYIKIFFDADIDVCWSNKGREGEGEQLMSLGESCWRMGIVLHELGHAAGLSHEMNRPDRDDWIDIIWKNVKDGFDTYFDNNVSVNMLGEHFDYSSIMMYGEYAYSKDMFSPTIQPKEEGVVIGQVAEKTRLSASDIRRIRKLYKCKGSRSKSGFPYDIYCNFVNDTCGFKDAGTGVWSWKNNTDGYVISTCLLSRYTYGYFYSVNMHPSRKDHYGCVRFKYYMMSQYEMILQLKQVYLDSVTQLNYNISTRKPLWETRDMTDKWTDVEVPIDNSRPFKIVFTSGFSDPCRPGFIVLTNITIIYRSCHGDEFSLQPISPTLT